MATFLAHVSIVVHDYDEAIKFYTEKFGFRLLEDRIVQDQGKRWVVIGPDGGGCNLVLGRASNDQQASRIGDQTGGRVFMFLETDDFENDFGAMVERGVEIIRPPQEFEYGTVAVVADLYGNLWDLIQRKT